jgi:DNA-directed RNA polymerase subunit L
LKIKVLKDEGKELDIEFDTKDLTIPDLIAAELLENGDVEFAGVSKDHPETGKPVLKVRTSKKKAVDAVMKSLESIEENFTKLKASISKGK